MPSGDVVAFRNLTTTPDGTGPYAPQGVDDLHDAASTESWIAGVDNAGFGALVLRSIAYSSTGAWPPSAISANLSLVVPATSLPLTVPHQGNVWRYGRPARRRRRPPLRRRACGTGTSGPRTTSSVDTGGVSTGRSQRIALVRDRRVRRRAGADAGGNALRFGGDEPSLLLDPVDRRLGPGPRRDRRERVRRDPARSTRRRPGASPATRPARCRARCSTRRARTAYNPPGRSRAAATLGRLLLHERRSRRTT